MIVTGQIIKQISNLYTVKVGESLYGCRARGKFRNDKVSPMVGDKVEIDIDDNLITTILPRKNCLLRPVIANVDIALIVTSVKKPNLDLVLLDKLISVVTHNNIEPVICLTKLDLLNEVQRENIEYLRQYYEMIGIRVVDNTETNIIKEIIKDNLVVLAGQTGAGKSSLINSLDSNLKIKTDNISEALGRGKHTTRHVETYQIGAGFIADTPGFSALDISNMTALELRSTFIEFSEYECKFNDCLHYKETSCGIKKALEEKKILQSRYDNYLLFLEEIKK